MNKLLFLPLLLFGFLIADPALSSDLQKGKDADENGDYVTAVKWYTLAAGQGNDRAQFNLGVMYKKGLGVSQDYKVAIGWYTLAAEQGNDRAQHNLGVMHAKGLGVSQDYKAAAKWYTLAAEQGYDRA
ncbi:MAG: sel1 repeat family protein [Aliivibrio sp.]|uniref:tetratricopeptide repeat protein n=1 Tax=Aliivibrio sp. TaxID=1872443 RepID=UPI001A641F9F|nr:sel1 repeat family protein [Aliivibrio sp.]